MTTATNLHEEDQRIASNPELAEFLYRELNTDIGAALKRARETRKLLQADIARMIGVQQSRISQIESTKGVGMTLDVLARYVAALGYRLDVDIVDPETEGLVSSLPVVPLSFMPVEEVEQRSSVSSVSIPLETPKTKHDGAARRHYATTVTNPTGRERDLPGVYGFHARVRDDVGELGRAA